MLTELYIEALLAVEAQADMVWEAWDRGVIDDLMAWLAWMLISFNNSNQSMEVWRQ